MKGTLCRDGAPEHSRNLESLRGWLAQLTKACEPEDGDEMEPTTTDILLAALKSAAAAHHVHEAENGPDPDWPEWYAAHMAHMLTEAGYRLSGTSG